MRLILIPAPVNITEMLPQDAATKIAQVHIDEGYIYEPFVKMMIIHRGNTFATNAGPAHQAIC